MGQSLTYKDAGVDITAGNELVNNIKKYAKTTHRPGVLTGIGHFGALFELPINKYQNPVLVSGTDGVGTKLRLAIKLKKHDTIGIDLVAMCVNDIVVMGADPLYFLDYYATGKLSLETAESVIKGISEACKIADIALVGGETAEMPGMYQADDYDLAGFCVGIVEKSEIIDGSKIQAGNKLIALTSSGVHSNGFSLVNKILTDKNIPLNEIVNGLPIGEQLLTPTKIYADSVYELAQKKLLKGAAHITGGGITENVPRILPPNLTAIIDTTTWQLPPLFAWLQDMGQITTTEMLKTFNCGVGMIVCVAKEEVSTALELLKENGETAWEIGEIREKTTENEPALQYLETIA